MLAGKTAVNKIFKKLARAGGERMAPAVLYRFLGFGVDVRSTWVTFCIVIVSSTVFHINSTPVYDFRKTASAYFETGNILSQLKFKLFHVSLIILQHSMTEVKIYILLPS